MPACRYAAGSQGQLQTSMLRQDDRHCSEVQVGRVTLAGQLQDYQGHKVMAREGGFGGEMLHIRHGRDMLSTLSAIP